MIPLSPAAERQLNELTRYYAERERDAAIDNLVDCVERASARYQANRGLFYNAPRPYPSLLRPGWRWTKEGRYWFAFGRTESGAVIRAIFYDEADIPGRV